jgi:flagellar motor protein MotB
MAAQQGRFDEAIDRFREVLLIEPDNLEAQDGLEKVRALKRSPVGRLRLRANGLLLAACALSLAFILWFLVGGWGSAPETEEESALPTTVTIDSATGLIAEAPEDGSMPAGTLAPVSLPEFEQPGVITRREGDQLVVMFEKGLFASGKSKPTDEGAETLRALGRALAAQPHPLSVAVEGHTDDSPLSPGSTYRDNQELGLARAVAVIAVLCREQRLSWARFTARGLGVEGAPYSFEGPSGRARNRTVVLRIETSRED